MDSRQKKVLVEDKYTSWKGTLFIAGFVDKGAISIVEQIKVEIIFSPK